MMQDLMNALPDEKPITSICIVEEPSKCPPGHQLVSKTHDQDTDADLWKDGFFRSKVTRYLCISKTVKVQEGHIVESIMISADKDNLPRDYSTIGMTRDTEQLALKKKHFCFKMGYQATLTEAVTDIIVLTKNTRRPPNGFINAGEINNLTICYKTGPCNTSPQNNKNKVEMDAKLPYQGGYGSANQGFPTWSPGYRPNINENLQTKALNSSVSYKTAIDGIPFEINAKYNVNKQANFLLPQIDIKTAEQLENEYGYDFRVEYQTQERIPSALQ